jgi:hypothetical protein
MTSRAAIILSGTLLLALTFSYCNKSNDPAPDLDPVNLTVTVLSVDHETGFVQIQASAQNAVKFELYIGTSNTPEQTNDNGFFEYTFGGEGVYEIEVRAYGNSGRYLKQNSTITIGQNGGSDPIPVDSGYFSPLEYSGYSLIWQDEFSGLGINSDNWSFEIGDGCPNLCGWGNNELEYYRAENAWVSDEVLTIEARQENFGGRNYTSARMITKGKQAFQYGRVDIRALLPEGQGMWPALWMLGNNISSVGWPKCGEIDIMEMIGGDNRENQCHGTAHWDYGQGHAQYGLSKTVSPPNLAEAYHVFSIVWDETSIKWFVDNQQYNELTITDPSMSEFHQEFFFIFNVAVGGNWPGNPNATTVFPQQMRVDYIRVFEKD